jgi:hypothetical protein
MLGWQSSAVEAVRLERIDASGHEVSAFRCGDPALDHWLHDEASSADHQADTSVRVAINGDHGRNVRAFLVAYGRVTCWADVLATKPTMSRMTPRMIMRMLWVLGDGGTSWSGGLRVNSSPLKLGSDDLAR